MNLKSEFEQMINYISNFFLSVDDPNSFIFLSYIWELEKQLIKFNLFFLLYFYIADN
jgi:hypothetical protein